VAKKRTSHGKRSASAAVPAKKPAPTPLLAMWLRFAVVAVASALAFLLPGIVALPGTILLRGVLAGLVAGLAARSWRELAACAAVGFAGVTCGAIATVAGTAVGQGSTSTDAVTAVLLALVVMGVIGTLGILTKRAIAGWVALAVVSLVFLATVGVLPGPLADATVQQRASFGAEPIAGQYGFDGSIFLRTEFLMEKGTPYYQAYLQAFAGDSRFPGATPAGLFGVRQPWLFWMWRYLPGPAGTKVWGWFIVWALGTAGAAYLLLRRFLEPAMAILGPIAVLGYLAAPTYSTWLTLSEFWGGCIAVWFIAAMVYRKWTLGAVLCVVAFAARELMLFLVPVYIVWWLVAGRPKRGLAGLGIILAGPVVLLGLQAWWSPVHGQSGGLGYWLNGGLDKLYSDLHFMGDLVPLSGILYTLVPIAALAGALMTPAKWTKALLATAVLVPVIALTVFSSPAWGEYWGAIAMPLLLALAPLAAVRLMPSEALPADPAVGTA
jgi:hypothetical protein